MGGMESLFGRYEAAALLAVERANGGELAPLEQVLASFEQLFGAMVTTSTLAESISLLIDAGLVSWATGGLELTVEGRRTIRRAGAHWDAELPEKVEARLALIGEDELAPEGELPAPTEGEIVDALQAFGRGGFEVRAPMQPVAPSGLAGVATMGARLLSGLPGGMGLAVELPGMPAAPTPHPRPAGAHPGQRPEEGAGPSSPPLVAPLVDDSNEDDSDEAHKATGPDA